MYFKISTFERKAPSVLGTNSIRAEETKNAIQVQRRKINGIDVSYEKLKISFFTVVKP